MDSGDEYWSRGSWVKSQLFSEYYDLWKQSDETEYAEDDVRLKLQALEALATTLEMIGEDYGAIETLINWGGKEWRPLFGCPGIRMLVESELFYDFDYDYLNANYESGTAKLIEEKIAEVLDRYEAKTNQRQQDVFDRLYNKS